MSLINPLDSVAAAETLYMLFEEVFEDADTTRALPREFEFWLSTTPEIEALMLTTGAITAIGRTDGLTFYRCTPNRRAFVKHYRRWKEGSRA